MYSCVGDVEGAFDGIILESGCAPNLKDVSHNSGLGTRIVWKLWQKQPFSKYSTMIVSKPGRKFFDLMCLMILKHVEVNWMYRLNLHAKHVLVLCGFVQNWTELSCVYVSRHDVPFKRSFVDSRFSPVLDFKSGLDLISVLKSLNYTQILFVFFFFRRHLYANVCYIVRVCHYSV